MSGPGSGCERSRDIGTMGECGFRFDATLRCRWSEERRGYVLASTVADRQSAWTSAS